MMDRSERFQRRGNLSSVVMGVALVVLVACAGPVPAQDGDSGLEAEVKSLLEQAKDHGAKGQLPQAWWDLDHRYDRARKQGATDEEWEALAGDARRLVNMAVFVESMRSRKSGLEALLNRYDQALDEIAALSGIDLPPELTGDRRAEALQAALQRRLLALKVRADSLQVANRRLQDEVGGRIAAQDSLITALRVENSSLRKKLWETELRAGVAEADRSAAESVLTRKQQFEDAVAKLRAAFTPEEGEVLLSPGGEVMVRLHGMAFGVGSAQLAAGQDDLIKRLEDGLRAFPGATFRVEGHTDDTGGRAANLRLSRRRAETVARRLEKDLGLQKGTIATEGFGPDRPVALNDTPEGRALNRRIDVVIMTEAAGTQE